LVILLIRATSKMNLPIKEFQLLTSALNEERHALHRMKGQCTVELANLLIVSFLDR
jgi:hypothetical protein